MKNKVYKLKDLYLDNLIDKETYKKDYENLSTQISKLENIEFVPQIKDTTNLKNLINANFDKIYLSLNFEEKRNFWLNVIDKIYIENGEIKEVIFL